METYNEDSQCPCKKSQVPNVTEDIFKLLFVQQDKMQEILLQRDTTLEYLRSKERLDNSISNRPVQLIEPNPTETKQCDEIDDVQCVNNHNPKLKTTSTEQQSCTNVECKQLRLECTLLKGLNKSIEQDNESLKMVNSTLQRNYDILEKRLNLVQSDHRLRLTQLVNANQVLNRSLNIPRTKKRIRSEQHDYDNRALVPCNKRKRSEGTGSDEESQAVVRCSNEPSELKDSSGVSISSSIDNDTSGTNDSDSISGTDLEDDADDDVFIQPTIEPIVIELSDSEADCTGSQSDDDPSDESSFLKPFSEYSIVSKQPNATLDQSSAQDGTKAQV